METQSTFWIAIFENKFTLWHIRLNIYILKTKFSSHNQYLFGLLFSRNAKETRKLCYSVWKETSHKPLKVAAAKKSFPSVYIIATTCFDECFLSHVITERHYFLYKFIVSQRFGETVMFVVFFETSVLKKSAFYICYLHNNTTMLLIPNVHNKVSTS